MSKVKRNMINNLNALINNFNGKNYQHEVKKHHHQSHHQNHQMNHLKNRQMRQLLMI